MSALGWSLPADCMTLPDEEYDIPAFCDSHCPDEEKAESGECACNPDNCEAFAIHIHLRSCLKHKETFGDGLSCNGCIGDAEYEHFLEMEKYEEELKVAGY